MPNLGDIDAQSLAGALATGTHGTGTRFPNLSGQVDERRAGPRRRQRADDRRRRRAAAPRASRLGALGVIAAVTLRCVPAFRLRNLDQPGAARRRPRARCRSAPTPTTTSSSGRSRTPTSRSRARTSAPRTRRSGPAGRSAYTSDILLDNHAFRAVNEVAAPLPAHDPAAEPLRLRRRLASASASTGRTRSSPPSGSCASRRWSTRCRASSAVDGGARRARRARAPPGQLPDRAALQRRRRRAALARARPRQRVRRRARVPGMAYEPAFREVEAALSAARRAPALGQALVPRRAPSWRRATRAGTTSRRIRAELDPDGRFANAWMRDVLG